MRDDGGQFDPRALDAAPHATLDPACFSANIAALEPAAPELTAALQHTHLPPHWRPAHTLDGAVSFRVEQPGEPPAWLTGSAAPLTRARGLLYGYDPANKNPALPTIAVGAELSLLLERLPRHMAIFVFESDMLLLAAALRCVRVDAAVRAHRVFFTPPAREGPHLTELLEREPGLQPPGVIVTPTLVSPERCAEIQRTCERLHSEVAARRSRELLALHAAATASAGPAGQTGLAIVARSVDPRVRSIARVMHEAAGRLGASAHLAAIDSPLDAHPLRHAAAVVAARPSVVLFVGQNPEVLGVDAPGESMVWALDAGQPDGPPPTNVRTVLAASPAVGDALIESGVSPDRVRPFYWAFPAAGGPQPPAEVGDELLLVADLPDDTAEALGIAGRDTHAEVWRRASALARQRWETAHAAYPGGLLLDAERAAGTPIEPETVRRRFVEWVRTLLLPAAALEAIAAALANIATLRIIGRGWARDAALAERVACADWLPAEMSARAAPWAVVFAGRGDPLSLPLVHAAGLGWSVALHAAAGVDLDDRLGGVLVRDQHFAPFDGLSTLQRVLQSIGSGADERRRANAREHVLRAHTIEARLRDLLA